MPKENWLPVKEINDWGSITATLNGKPFTPDTYKPGKIDVMFPTGTIVSCTLQWEGHTEHVSDMGRESVAHSTVAVIVFDYHGLKVRQRLSAKGLKIKV